jgi:hypothetical protein
VGSIPTGSTTTTLENHYIFRFAAQSIREQKSANVCGTRHKKRGKCVANRGRCSSKIPLELTVAPRGEPPTDHDAEIPREDDVPP